TSWQFPYNSCLQKTHFPQAILNGTITLSPTVSFSTAEPISTTSPINSWPNVEPTRVSGTNPWYKCKSDPQIQVRNTLTMASSGCSISGYGLSRSARTLKGPLKFIANIFFSFWFNLINNQ